MNFVFWNFQFQLTVATLWKGKPSSQSVPAVLSHNMVIAQKNNISIWPQLDHSGPEWRTQVLIPDVTKALFIILDKLLISWINF